MNEYCPFTSTCPFYQNLVELTKTTRMDVITTKYPNYSCLALAKVNTNTSRVITAQLSDKVSPLTKEFSCSYITLLNKLNN